MSSVRHIVLLLFLLLQSLISVAQNDTASLSGDGDCSTGDGGIRAGDGDDRSIDGCDRSIDTAKRTTAPRHPFRISFEG